MNLQYRTWNTSGESTKIISLKRTYHKFMKPLCFGEKIYSCYHVGKWEKKFIGEVSRFMSEWIHDSLLKDIAFKAIMVMPSLLLQKPSQKSKSKDHLRTLEWRLDLWESGEVMELLKESDTIQTNMKVTNKTTSINKISKKFTREMMKGYVQNAMKFLTNNIKNGVLPLHKMTLKQLKQKHPQSRDVIRRLCYQINKKKFNRLSSILSTQKMLEKQLSKWGVE